MQTNVNTRWGMVLAVALMLILASCSRGPSDESISAAVKSSYFSDPAVKNESIDISVDHGEVTLAGKVSSDAARLQAYKLADGKPGVKKGKDKMEGGAASGVGPAKPVTETPKKQ